MTYAPPRFRPFEYMAWAKQVAPGAAFPMHVSGMPAPDAALLPPLPGWEAALAPSRTAWATFAERAALMVGAPGRAAVPAAGASEAIFVALAPFVQRDAPVIVEQPAYRAMERVAQFLGGVPVRVERQEQDGWQLDPERLDAVLRATGARVVGITDPHNPTGVSLDAAARAAVIGAVERHGALLVVDEIFAPFRGSGRAPAWAAASDNVLSLGSLTKGWGLSSLRAGWVLGAHALVERCAQVFDLLDVNPATVSVLMGTAALDAGRELDVRALTASRRVNEVFAATEWGAAAMAPPDDGIIGFLRLPPGWTSRAAVTALRALDGVQVVPGHFFGCDGHLRIGFAGDGFEPAEGCRRVAARLNGPPIGAGG